jgi:hypothetical protein
VVRVDVGFGVGLVRAARTGLLEESVVLVENFTRNQQEPLSLEASCVVARLVDEGDLDFALEFADVATHQLVV